MSDEPLTTPLPEPEPVAQIPPVLPVYPPPPMPVTVEPMAVPTQAGPVTFAVPEQPVFAPPPPPAPPATPAPPRTLGFTAADLPGRTSVAAPAPVAEPEPVAQIPPVLPVYPPPPMPGVTVESVTVPTHAGPVTFAVPEQPVFAPPPPPAPPATPAPPRTLGFAAADLPGRTSVAAPAPLAAPEPVLPAAAPPASVAPKGAGSKALQNVPPRKRGLLVWGGFGLAVVLLLAAIGYVVYDRYWADPLEHVVKGHCLADLPLVSGDEELDVTPPRVVPCEDPAAVYVVEGNIKGLSEAQSLDPQVCAEFDDATYVYRAVPPGGRGYVLCLRLRNG